MKIDEPVQQVITQLRKILIKRYDKNFTDEQIISIVDSQFRMIPIAMEQDKDIKLNYIGKFKIKRGRIDAEKSTKELLAKGYSKERVEQVLSGRAKKFATENSKVMGKLVIPEPIPFSAPRRITKEEATYDPTRDRFKPINPIENNG